MSLRVVFVLVPVLCLCGGVASAADDRSAGVGGTVAAMNVESDTALSFSGSFEYRFTRVVGLEVEATLAPRLRSPFPTGGYTILAGESTVAGGVPVSGSVLSGTSIAIFPPPSYTNRDGRVVIVSNNVRVAIPTTATRLEPYFVAGGGIANVRHTADLVYNPFPVVNPLAGTGLVLPTRSITQHLTASSVDLALTLGGGVGVRASSQLWIDADLRMFRLMGNTDRNVGRFGVGARYRF